MRRGVWSFDCFFPNKTNVDIFFRSQTSYQSSGQPNS